MKQTIQQTFQLRDRDVRETSALSLAFLGDSVYELVVRTVLVEKGGRPGGLNREKSRLVNAGAQAGIAQFLLERGLLTGEEEAVYRRGRNANPHMTAKHASIQEYHRATGLECLIGWLYLKGETKRLTELIRTGLEYLEIGAAEGENRRERAHGEQGNND